MIVEFTGLTGAGKTTFAAAVKDALSDEGLRMRDAYELILGAWELNAVRHPVLRSLLVDVLVLPRFLRRAASRDGWRLVRLAVRLIRRDSRTFLTAMNQLRNLAKRIGVHAWLRSRRHLTRQCDLVSCDEGILHLAHGLFVHDHRPPERDEIVLFGKLVPMPDVVVWIKAPEDQSVACIRQRGHQRVDDSPLAARTFVEHGRLAFGVLCSLESIQDRLVVVDGLFGAARGTIEDRAGMVSQVLQRRLSEGVSAGE